MIIIKQRNGFDNGDHHRSLKVYTTSMYYNLSHAFLPVVPLNLLF